MKTKQPRMIVVRRPKKSARSPAMIAPKKVPADKMETIKDFFHDGSTNAALVAFDASGPGMGIPVYRWIK